MFSYADVIFVMAGLLLGMLLPEAIRHFRSNPIIRLRNRIAKMLIRKYNRDIPLSGQEQMLLEFFHEKGIVYPAYMQSLNPKRYRFILSDKAIKDL